MEDARALLSSWGRGDMVAGQRLFERHCATVERFFVNKVGIEAPEFVEETFVRLREGLHATEMTNDVVVELLRCARVVLLEHLSRRCTGELDPSTHCVNEIAPPTLESTVSERAKDLRDALRRLAVNEQLLLELHLWERLEPHQRAAVVDRPEAEIDALVQAAEHRLAEVLAERQDAHAAQDPERTPDTGERVFSTRAGSDPSARARAPPTPPGRRLGQYMLVRRLGVGGMGEVFEAHHIDTGERVALKQLSKVDATGLYRFKREFRALADVSHPNLVRLGELVVPTEGPAFFTMELLDGVPFVEYVRAGVAAGRAPDPLHLRRAFRQLVAGVICMHEVECIHRDLKPSNVLVTRQGRVVILDFGLVAASDDPGQGMTRDGQVLGTPAYMAPEQAGPESRGEPVDYYALGVILYESLTGTLPFEGAPLQILVRKEQSEAPDPEAVVTGIPADLRQLCTDLLARDPARRPTGPQVLARLRGTDAGLDEPFGRPARARTRVPFVGRVRELELLETALHDVRTHKDAVTMHVRGTSGLGKTALVREMLRRVKTDELTILQGRCFERESVPYKGVDAVIDALAAWLRRLPEDQLERIRPRHLEPLTQIFPVLDAVWNRDLVEPSDHPPHELRRLGLIALREVMTRLADERVLIVHVDDFQWADEDGARLLGALVRPPDAPSMLLIASFRDEVDEHEALRVLVTREELLGRDVRELVLEPMPPEDAEALARAFFVAQGQQTTAEDLGHVRSSVERAKGNPFFLGQLVRGEKLASDEDLPLDQLVVRRLVQLEDDARRVLVIVAAASRPIAPSVVGRIFGDPGWKRSVSILEELGLVVRRGTTSGDLGGSSEFDGGCTLETAHDRIREVVISEMETNELRVLHLELADELEHAGGKPELIAEHLWLGGARGRALEHIERAADGAARTLAFGRAAVLYRRALELLGDEVSGRVLARRRHLRTALARQLVALGHCDEAGDLLRSLATEVPPEQALTFNAEASGQLMLAGRTEEGVELASTVMQALGEPPLRGPWMTLLGLAWERLRLWIRGLEFRSRSEAELPPAALERLDLQGEILIGLSKAQALQLPVLNARLLRYCLNLGEPRRVGLGLTAEMVFSKALGLHRRASRIQEQVRLLADEVGDLELDQMVHNCVGVVQIMSDEFAEAADRYRILCYRLAAEPTAYWVSHNVTRSYVGLCLDIGRWRELEHRFPQWLATATERGILTDIAELEVYAAVVHAHLGDHARAREHLRAAREVPLPAEYSLIHFILDDYEGRTLLVLGSPKQALELAEKLHRELRRFNFAVARLYRRLQHNLSTRCHLILAMHAPADSARQRTVRSAIRRQRRSRFSVDRTEALLGEAALSSLRGDDDATLRHWREAEALCIENRLEAHLAAVRWRLGSIDDGDDAQKNRTLAETHARSQGWKDPERIFDLLAPVHRR